MLAGVDLLLELVSTTPVFGSIVGAESSTVQEESPPSAYVPPHLRGRGGKSSAPQFSLGHSTDQAGRIRSAAQQQQQESGVPGGSTMIQGLMHSACNTWTC